MTFEREQLIRFSHCDPAGIVFFPQYFVLFNGLVEDWFDDALALGYERVVIGQRTGLPTVALNCEFLRPSRMGERVTLGLAVRKLGRSSITLDVSCRHGDELRVRVRQVIVTTSLDDGLSRPIADNVRAAIERFGITGDAPEPRAAEGKAA
ncbi:MAG: acyl-CoA thioesterase [Rhizobacter sp.]|jgi:4-hydroxybenzoyl-CoA thioesterase|nr:acyl-CoA thioesterase [Burkholderiaceae bacterium]MCO5122802.1 acyl-CoA thioesterase [Rhizobacter sp.]